MVAGFPFALFRFALLGSVVDEVSHRIGKIAEAGLEGIEGGLVIEHDEGHAGHDKQQY